MFDNFGKCGPILKFFPPHVQYVATLPCESRNPQKMLPKFHVKRDS